MLGQFFVEPDEDEPVEPLEGADPLDPEDPLADVPPDEVPEDVPPVDVLPDELVDDVLPELVLEELVAALATSAPPATRPLVRAPTASALRSRSFMVLLPPEVVHTFPRHEGTGALCGTHLWVGPYATQTEIRVVRSAHMRGSSNACTHSRRPGR
jgi:hypothetical protein